MDEDTADGDFLRWQAYFRAAKAAVALENHEAAIRYCTQGLEQEEENKELQQIAAKSRKKLAEHEAQMKVAEDRRAAAEVRRSCPAPCGS